MFKFFSRLKIARSAPGKSAAGLAVLAFVGAIMLASPTVAQSTEGEPIIWDARRLSTLERNVRRIERALFQRNSSGQPFIMEPDPEVVALQGQMGSVDTRLSDVERTLQRMNGDIERLTFALDETERENTQLRRQLTDAEARIAELESAARLEAELNAPIEPNSPSGTAGGDLRAADRLMAQDSRRGARAYEILLVTWPDAPEARLAAVRLADLYLADDAAAAVPLYAQALSGWPTEPWAAKATVDLAQALVATDRNTQACAALTDFNRRYAETAPAALKTRATSVRTGAGCR
jgi:TolA-binding protein